ncbi:monovalent cation/H+ antiporter complex subunit F [Streptomyces sp. NPDC088817]|uniref:monovalent cation/H+ antiporter complex subunit F n=1 Tax=Streptomyces sp. NPDC088817 TaxID=3365907 RepID=UPI0037FD1342
MNTWTAAALVLVADTVPAYLWVVSRGTAVRRLTGAALLPTTVGAVFLVLPQAYHRPAYQDLALMLAVLAPAGTLVFTRFVAGSRHETRPTDVALSQLAVGTALTPLLILLTVRKVARRSSGAGDLAGTGDGEGRE